MCIHSITVPYMATCTLQCTTRVHVPYMHNVHSVWGNEGRMYLITNNSIEKSISDDILTTLGIPRIVSAKYEVILCFEKKKKFL